MMFSRKKNINTFYRVDKVRVPTQPRRRLVRDYYQHPGQQLQRRIIIIISAIALIILWQAALQMPAFSLTTITIKGLTYIPADNLKPQIETTLHRKRWLFFHNDNYFLFRPFDLANQLKSDFALQEVSIKKHFPHTLEITATEGIAPFVRQTSTAYYKLSFTGQTQETVPSVPDHTTVIADERLDQSQDIPLSYLQQASAVLKAWNIKMVTLQKFHLTDDADTIIISVDKGYRLYLSTQDDYSLQINRYNELISQNYLPAGIQYVDLRFGDYLYFK
jgi:cell division septal protein FtsQ